MGNVYIYIFVYIYMYNYIVHASCRHQLIFELGGTTEKVGIFVGPIVNRESYIGILIIRIWNIPPGDME